MDRFLHKPPFRIAATGLGALLIASAAPAAAATQALPSSLQPRDGATYTILPQSLAVLRRGAKPSLGIRYWHGKRRYLKFPTKIQHIVVIDMENRTLDNLFAAYYGTSWQDSPTVQWQNVMNIASTTGPPALTANPLATTDGKAAFDPDHEHDSGFLQETLKGFGSENLGCHAGKCQSNATAYSYVPIPEVDPYAQLIQHYASADEVFQANEGPSMPSHQYLIAGQSGAIPGSLTSPLGIASNPGAKGGDEDVAGNFPETGEEFADGSPAAYAYCDYNHSQPQAPALDLIHFRQPELTSENPPINPPCESYTNGTILDEIANSPLGTPPFDDWQYIAAQLGGFWAAPTAVANLYSQYEQGPVGTEPFAVDPNAYRFVQNLNSSNPQRPFAALTYITPCFNASDHPSSDAATDYGPQWVGALVNAIGTAQNGRYWPNTAIIVTWDDWGGWYDHVPFPESAHNPYNNALDPNEWGFRVPFIVISPYVTQAGYVSHGPNGGTLTSPVARSQSAILQFIETIFDLPSLGTDDAANDPNDNLMDMFNFNNQLPFTPVNNLHGYSIPQTC